MAERAMAGYALGKERANEHVTADGYQKQFLSGFALNLEHETYEGVKAGLEAEWRTRP